MPTSLPRILRLLGALATAAALVRLVADDWGSAVLFAGVALVCAGSLTFRARPARPVGERR